ncbi:MAG: exo-alpha-sialidase [Candidatus Hydrogenedentes bacterium]|nr:exo-alpha-sialidase [Candidatus Hydrogenedentota bacterium]
MNSLLLTAITWGVFAAADAMPPESYLLRVDAAVQQAGGDAQSMAAPANEAAARMIAGGKLWAGGNPAFVSELCGRAGGLMMIATLGDATPAAGDVLLYGLADAPPPADAVLNSGAYIVTFGDAPVDGAAHHFNGYSKVHAISPTLASIIPAWCFTGELIGACVAQGKMPVTYETIGLPGGYPRIQQYQSKGNFWIDVSTWEEKPAGDAPLGAQFAGKVSEILRRIEKEERAKLDLAGAWATEALATGKTVYMYGMGHFIPDELAKTEIGTKFETAEWNSGFTSLKTPEDNFSAGDLAIHIGYQHPPNGLFDRARPAGARVIYIEVLEHRDWKNDGGVVWIDPMWPWDDAVVSLKGYDVPMLPPSGIVNSAIAWELYRLATQGELPTVLASATAERPRHSEASIVPLKDGSLLLGWTEFYGGDSADHGAAQLSGRISKDGGLTWGEQFVLVENDGGRNVMEVNFVRLLPDSLALLYCQKNTESTDCRIMMRQSADEGKTWGDAKQLSPDNKYTGLTNGRAIRLKTGRILVEAWEGGDSYCVMSDDNGETWRDGARVKPAEGDCWEPACIELKDGRVMMLMRTQLGGQYMSHSNDGGENWSAPVATDLKGSAAPVAISRIPATGDLLAVWNHNPGRDARYPLTSAISKDEGATWTSFKNIESDGDQWAYPAITWVDGAALVTYFNYSGGHSLLLRRIPAAWFYSGE